MGRGLVASLGIALLASTILSVSLAPTPAFAQTAARGTLASLPPALRAAVTAGNSEAISRAITTLAGGNPVRAGDLANQVIAAAEGLLATNPQGAIAAASAAVDTVRSLPTQQAAPTQVQTVITTAARIFINPAAQRTAPVQAAALANSTMAVAQSAGNSTGSATVANAAVQLAEGLVASNPAAAVQLAASAVQAVQNTNVQNAAPQQTMSVVTTAARIIIQPAAQNVAPQQVASISVATAQIASVPVVYQSNPQAAVQVMSSSFSAATSTIVSAAAPQTAATVTQTLNTASTNTALSSANATNAAQVNAILARPSNDPVQTATTTPAQTNTTPQAQQQQQQQQRQQQTNNNTNNPAPVVVDQNPILTGSPT